MPVSRLPQCSMSVAPLCRTRSGKKIKRKGDAEEGEEEDEDLRRKGKIGRGKRGMDTRKRRWRSRSRK